MSQSVLSACACRRPHGSVQDLLISSAFQFAQASHLSSFTPSFQMSACLWIILWFHNARSISPCMSWSHLFPTPLESGLLRTSWLAVHKCTADSRQHHGPCSAWSCPPSTGQSRLISAEEPSAGWSFIHAHSWSVCAAITKYYRLADL